MITMRSSSRMAVAIGLLSAMIWPAESAAFECSGLGPAIVDHTCFHARLGPFKSATVSASGAPSSDNLNDTHTYFAIAMTSASGKVGTLPYTPARSGRWAFYVQYDVPIEVRDGNGTALEVIHADTVPGCPFLARVEVVLLTAATTYQVALGPTVASEVGLVIEKLEDFEVIQGRDRDGDGFGDAKEFVVSPCLPSAGYVSNDEDCDDGDPQIHPGAVELCGQKDRNCNGIDGDVGAACVVGTGACAQTAVATCPELAQPPVCEAVADDPGVELCNGIDDDCDGLGDDVEPGLCASADQPRCVADGRGTRFCGCESDADCGAPDSARLCSLRGVEQRCVDGCVDGFGRNSCGQGMKCTSTDPAAPGTCVEATQPSAGGCGVGGPVGNISSLLLLLWWLRRQRRTNRALE
jgi:Putative metal-binding motif